MNITVLYVGSSLLGPLKDAEREINRVHKLRLRVAAYNFGSPLNDAEWSEVDDDLKTADIVFVMERMRLACCQLSINTNPNTRPLSSSTVCRS
jgi:hypothetical protein